MPVPAIVRDEKKRVDTASAPAYMSGAPAQVAELVDAQVSGTCAARRGGSSPLLGTIGYPMVELSSSSEDPKAPIFRGDIRRSRLQAVAGKVREMPIVGWQRVFNELHDG